MKRLIARLWSSASHRHAPRPRRSHLRLEQLEDRLAPAVLTVTTLTDELDAPSSENGQLSLREAITSINNQADFNTDATNHRVGGYASTPGGTADVINFNIPGGSVRTIAVGTDPTATGIPEPDIIMPLTIDGYTENNGTTQATPNTQANSDDAVILIQLDGPGAGANADGLVLAAGSGGSTIRGLDITNFSGHGIVVQSNANLIAGNFVGVDPTGTTRMPNGTL